MSQTEQTAGAFAHREDRYPFTKVEKKWQKHWQENEIFKAEPDSKKKKFYMLEQYPYPSGRIHMGHVRVHSIGDVLARYFLRRGYNVMHPIGYDAFGLPAENAAIERGEDPEKWTRANIENMSRQLKDLGFAFDWSREIQTCDKEYYRWNQWLFTKMFEKGLAYRKKSTVNWCPDCNTVLANEQVVDGFCWRHGETKAEEKTMEQWFLKITEYVDELIDELDNLPDWPERIVAMQKNWMGRSYGTKIIFRLAHNNEEFPVFTTRPDTTFGVTYMSMAAEHPLTKQFIEEDGPDSPLAKFVREFREDKLKAKTLDELEKKGIDTGRKIINPVNGDEVPLYAANYVLMEYGTGAVMAVPAHDQRDFEFAKLHEIPIKIVIQNPEGSLDVCGMTEAYIEPGVIVNSAHFDGLPSKEAIDKMSLWMAEQGFGERTKNYRLRDWGISRQRYWGTPIPMIYCDKCGIVPVPDKDLPVVLPSGIKFKASSESPLAGVPEFVKVDCPKCGAVARRETDTMDTFVDSSWYFCRYLDPHNHEAVFDKDKCDYWMNVDRYVGGPEHATLHDLYARFLQKFMRDLGVTDVGEPFKELLVQGMVLKDGTKMSKSKGNVVDPDEILEKYGADTMRTFILFAAPYDHDMEWSAEGVEGSSRFLNRVWRLVTSDLDKVENIKASDEKIENKAAVALRRKMHQTIAKVSDDIETRYAFNTSISAVMELVNQSHDFKPENKTEWALQKAAFETIVHMLYPFAPHITEELWHRLGHTEELAVMAWPEFKADYAREDEIELVLQVNGKVRARVDVPIDTDKAELEKTAMAHERVQQFIEGKTVRKVIVVPNKLVNIVAN